MSIFIFVWTIIALVGSFWMLFEDILAILPWIALAGLAWLAYCHRAQIERFVDYLRGAIKRSSLRFRRA